MYTEVLKNVPNNPDKIWTIAKTSETLVIYCNEVEVMRMMFRDRVEKHYTECSSKWSQVVSHIGIIKGAVAYRKGGKNALQCICDLGFSSQMINLPRTMLLNLHYTSQIKVNVRNLS